MKVEPSSPSKPPKDPTLPVYQLLTEQQVSDITGIRVRTLQNWRLVGDGPVYIKLGNGLRSGVRYDLADIRKYLNAARRYPSMGTTQER